MEEAGRGSIATIRHVVEIVAIVAAGIWAFYTFIYEERIKPAHEPLASVETVTMTREGRIRDLDIVRLNVTIRNVGKTEFDTVAQELDVFGFRYGRDSASRTITPHLYSATDEADPTQQHLILARVELYDAAVHGNLGLHNIVDAGSQTGGSYLIAIPHGRYDLLRAHFRYFPHKTPISERFLMKVSQLPDGSFSVSDPSERVLEDNVYSELALTQ